MADQPKAKRKSYRVPKHRKHATGQGVVTLAGKDYYTGKWGTAASEEKYRQLTGEWVASGRTILPTPKPAANEELGISVADLCLRFVNWARATFGQGDEEKSSSFIGLEYAAKMVGDRFRLLPAARFGPKHFHELRDEMVQARYARSTINYRAHRIRRIFKWGAERELIPFEVYVRLSAVASLKPGELGVREKPRVAPVADAVVDKTMTRLKPTMRAVVKILRRTGARVGEICRMRPCDINTSGEVWSYKPSRHKTEAHAERVIYFGPQARETLAPMLEGLAPDQFIFRRVRSKNRRILPVHVAKAIKAAAASAGVPHWHPHQLRHTRLHELREAGKLDEAQAVAGHSRLEMTQHYATLNAKKAESAARDSG